MFIIKIPLLRKCYFPKKRENFNFFSLQGSGITSLYIGTVYIFNPELTVEFNLFSRWNTSHTCMLELCFFFSAMLACQFILRDWVLIGTSQSGAGAMQTSSRLHNLKNISRLFASLQACYQGKTLQQCDQNLQLNPTYFKLKDTLQLICKIRVSSKQSPPTQL